MDGERDPRPETVGMAGTTVPRGHEDRDVRARTIFVLGVGFVVAGAVIQVVLWFHLRGLWALRPSSRSSAACSSTAGKPGLFGDDWAGT